MKPKCDRCGKENVVTSTSWLNKDTICMGCAKEEEQHPFYAVAKEVEHLHCTQGNYNFAGIFAGLNWEQIKELKREKH